MSVNWNEKDTGKLIALRGKKYSYYFENTNSKQRMNGWKAVKNEMNTIFSVQQIKRKWAYLLRRYKDIQIIIHNEPNEKCKTLHTQSWSFYTEMKSILKDKFIIPQSPSNEIHAISFDSNENSENSYLNGKVKEEDDDFIVINEKMEEQNEEFVINKEMEKLCGEIFTTSSFVLTFKCQLCNESFKSIEEFSHHLSELHLNIICCDGEREKFNFNENNNYEIDTSESNINMGEMDIELNKNNYIEAKDINDFNFEKVLIENDTDHIYFERDLSKDKYKLRKTEELQCDRIKQKKENNHDSDKNQFSENLQLLKDKRDSENNEFSRNTLILNDLNGEDFEEKNKTVSKKEFECSLCGLYLASKENLITHEKTHNLKCEFCEEMLSSVSVKKKHLKKFHFENLNKNLTDHNHQQLLDDTDCASNKQSMKIFKCNECSAAFTRKVNLNLHLSRHENNGKIKCKFCGEFFFSYYKLSIHKKNHVNRIAKKFMCVICSKLFPTQIECNEHKKLCFIGKDKKTFSCEVCHRVFEKKQNFLIHSRTHQGIRPHQCHFCEKSFSDLTNFKVHINRHLGQKKYQCQYCEKRFVSSTEKKIHERSHRGEKPFLCTECGRSFVTSSALSNHLKRHTGRKPHKCEYCDKSFYTLKLLRNHDVKHTGLRPFKCDTCSATFPRKTSLIMHENLHLDIARYACNMCDRRFKQCAGLYSHLKSHNIAPKTKIDK